MNATLVVTDRNGNRSTLLVLTRDQAEHTALLHRHDRDFLAFSRSDIFADAETVHLRSMDGPQQEVAFLPALALQGKEYTRTQDGLWSKYLLPGKAVAPQLTVVAIRTVVSSQTVRMGPYIDWRKGSVPLAPDDAAFETGSAWAFKIDEPGLKGVSNVYLEVDYSGDVAHLQSGGVLLDDNFYNGQTWRIGLKRFNSEVLNGSLDLKVLPMLDPSLIYLDAAALAKLNRSRTNPKLIRARLLPEYEVVVLTHLP
jgi:hypothetical protein